MAEKIENQIVVKSNYLIGASYKLTIQEMKIIFLLASMIEKGDDKFQLYKMKVKNFMKFTGVEGKDAYSRIKKITRKLKQRELIIKEPKTDRELQLSWLASADYLGNGYVELELSQKLKPYLIKLKNFFTKIELEMVVRFRSKYSIRIYELLKQYEKIGKREFEVDQLKNILGLDSKYQKYCNFKKKVILVAQKELAEKADIYFSFSEEKEARKVKKIIFHIKKNPPAQKLSFSEQESEKYFFSSDMKKICKEIGKKEDKNKFSPELFVKKALKERKHPEAIVLVLRRLNDYWEVVKENPWGYGQKVLDIESGNYHEREAIKEHKKLKNDFSIE
jgi:plasmid replication initiation protein